MKNKLLLIGCGYWGKNWYNTILKSENCELVGVVDPNPAVAVFCARFDSIEEVNVEYTHAIIATNAESHLQVKSKLKCKNVLIEKPCGTDETRKDLLDVFPGFIFLHSPQFNLVKRIIESKKLGKVFFCRFERASMGPRIRTDVSIIEDYAIHDLYIYASLFNPKIEELQVAGKIIKSFDDRVMHDTLFMNLSYDGVNASFYSSWRNHSKTRKIEIVGENGTLIWENDEVWINESRYHKIHGFDKFRNPGYELVLCDKVKLDTKESRSNLELELKHFLSSDFDKKILSITHDLIFKVKNSLVY